MIPSLVLVRSNTKRLVTLTLKRTLKIGADQDCDIIVNHPHLHKHPQVLGPGSTSGETPPRETTASKPSKVNRAITSFFLPAYSFNLDGLNVRMVHLKTLFNILLITCIGIVSITAYLIGHSAFSITQDWTPIALPAEGVYGYCRQDRTHSEGARFSFEAKESQAYRLVFFTGGKGDGATITLFLNGTAINKPISLPAGWGEEISVPLPSAHIREGNNTVEVRPKNITSNSISWGISEVRALPAGQVNSHDRDTAAGELRMIMEALKKRDMDMGGPELAHYYKTVSSWETITPSESFPFDRDGLMEEIEQRMKIKLHQVAFDVRSRNILGNEPAIRQLLNVTRSWIPGSWLEGWEIYNELYR